MEQSEAAPMTTPRCSWKRKRLVYGKDWHGWAYWHPNASVPCQVSASLCHPDATCPAKGRWVRIRITEVKR